uniref:Uncharacterized protein n=1 Tax=Rhizobium meliloti TaxID=382 RepID=I2E1X8_RHIML|nr:short hypothetical protein [Sinorhizobium meliloti]
MPPDRSWAITCAALCHHASQETVSAGKQPFKTAEKQAFMDGH